MSVKTPTSETTKLRRLSVHLPRQSIEWSPAQGQLGLPGPPTESVRHRRASLAVGPLATRLPVGRQMHSGLQLCSPTAALRMNRQSLATGRSPTLERLTGRLHQATGTVVEVVVEAVVVVVAIVVVVTRGAQSTASSPTGTGGSTATPDESSSLINAIAKSWGSGRPKAQMRQLASPVNVAKPRVESRVTLSRPMLSSLEKTAVCSATTRLSQRAAPVAALKLTRAGG